MARLAPGERLAQSARTDYSIKWTESGLVGTVPADAVGDWPSDRWRKHLAHCGPVRECRHRVPAPEWWVLMSKRGLPLHPDAEQARELAYLIINKWRGHPPMPDHLLGFTHDMVRDCLMIAPQPVTKTWVEFTLSCIGMLVRSVAVDNGPLTREHVFSKPVVDRFLYHHMRGHAPSTVANYRRRTDFIQVALKGVTIRNPKSQPSLSSGEAIPPLTSTDEAALYQWACGVRPAQRRDRVVAVVTLGLAFGPTTSELLQLTPEDFAVDDQGIHVVLTTLNDETRTVTCRREWEDRVAALLEVTSARRYMTTPWRDTPITEATHYIVLNKAQELYTPPVYFNSSSLRNTWLVRHMEAGVPLRSLMKAAGLRTTESLSRMMGYCEPQTDEEIAAALRGPQ
ncbi:tyrosine-type recombinase/integrase [Nocardioides sp. URHA0032]|uniref:tyrosine-type recombinase/integrase n=1 Tax=Nocardioides sp. URHA0032 TaxID=1380388 RepID=UPI0012DD32D9|nr:tyrosine-type recombinase/integrase [Nocardioides sp. URHA0032]